VKSQPPNLIGSTTPCDLSDPPPLTRQIQNLFLLGIGSEKKKCFLERCPVWQVGHASAPSHPAYSGVQRIMKPLLFALALLALTPRHAAACSCVPLQGEIDLREWLKQFDGAVFEGTLLRQEQVGKGFDTQLKLTYRVNRHWKGVTSPQVVVYTPTDSGMCGIGAEPKVSRFIIASRTPMGLQTGICHYTFHRSVFRAAVGEGSPPPKR
jgi:hypothetical protein